MSDAEQGMSAEGMRALKDWLNEEGANPIAHPCENVLQKLEVRLPEEQIGGLRWGAMDATFAGVEFGDVPATLEEQKRLQDAENAEIHRLNHLTKESAQHARRGGGRPSKRQQERLAGSFTADVVEENHIEPTISEIIVEFGTDLNAPIPAKELFTKSDAGKAKQSKGEYFDSWPHLWD